MEEALRTKERLWQAATSGRLMAYADDLVICGKDLAELEVFIEDLEELNGDWNLKINHGKCEILAHKETDLTLPVKGIVQSLEVKYLGVTIAQEDNALVRKNKAQVGKYLGYIKGRLRTANLDVKAALAQAYIKSLLLYFGVPLVAANVLKEAQVQSWENELVRQLHLLPRDIKRSAITNLVDQGKPLLELLREQADKARLATDRQSRLELGKASGTTRLQ